MRDWEEYEVKIWKKLNENGVGAFLNSHSGKYRLGDIETREFIIDCKYNRYPRIHDYLSFLEKYGEKTNKIPAIVYHHKSARKDYVLLRLEDFLRLMKIFEAWKHFETILYDIVRREISSRK